MIAEDGSYFLDENSYNRRYWLYWKLLGQSCIEA